MQNAIGRLARPLAIAAAIFAGACSGHAYLSEGDQKSATVGYSGNLDDATAVARRHCAGYERVARLSAKTVDTAYFDCVPQ